MYAPVFSGALKKQEMFSGYCLKKKTQGVVEGVDDGHKKKNKYEKPV